jgi:glycerophosphoryl diester phosphodiesterase
MNEKTRDNTKALKHPRVDLQGHRGARGYRPENTLPAFQLCMDSGMDTMELDVRITADRQLLVHHDPKINKKRCVDENGMPAKPLLISKHTADMLKKFDCGSKGDENFPHQVPVRGAHPVTLPELFAFVKEYEKKNKKVPVKFNIELKYNDFYTLAMLKEGSKLIVAGIEENGMVERTTIQSFKHDSLPEIKKLNPGIKTSAIFDVVYPVALITIIGMERKRRYLIERAMNAGADILSPEQSFVDTKLTADCHARGLEVIPWTVNDEDAILNMLDCGVDGIISDYPDRLMNTYKQWLAGQ